MAFDVEPATAEFLEDCQYNTREILEDEHLFGRNYYNIGGEAENLHLLSLAEPMSPRRVLDVGCGLGGPARLIAERYGATVDGVDVSRPMVDLAQSRIAADGMVDRVRIFLGDILTFDVGDRYELVFSNCAFLHVHDKPRLLARIRGLLQPGGTLLFGDFCLGNDGPEMQAYVRQYRHHLLHIEEWCRLLDDHGFDKIAVEDGSARFLSRCQLALRTEGISEEWQGVLTKRIGRMSRGEHLWGLFAYRARAGESTVTANQPNGA